MTAKKCTKKHDARAKLLFCQSSPIAVLTFSSPSSDLKVPTLVRARASSKFLLPAYKLQQGFGGRLASPSLLFSGLFNRFDTALN